MKTLDSDNREKAQSLLIGHCPHSSGAMCGGKTDVKRAALVSGWGWSVESLCDQSVALCIATLCLAFVSGWAVS